MWPLVFFPVSKHVHYSIWYSLENYYLVVVQGQGKAGEYYKSKSTKRKKQARILTRTDKRFLFSCFLYGRELVINSFHNIKTNDCISHIANFPPFPSHVVITLAFLLVKLDNCFIQGSREGKNDWHSRNYISCHLCGKNVPAQKATGLRLQCHHLLIIMS